MPLPNEIGALTEFGPAEDVLGETPVWSEDEKALFWVDVRGQAIRRLDPVTGKRQSWAMPDLVGCMVLRQGGGMVLGLRSSIAAFDPELGAVEPLFHPHSAASSMRLNDGKCDRQGRFWVGSMDDVGRGPVGQLYRVDARGCIAVTGGVAVPNSLCWSPDGTTMYFADGIEPVIWAYPFDITEGLPGPRREFARLQPGTGIPDGATIDTDGCLWSAQYGGGVVTRYAPDGEVLQVIPVPVSQPTSCAFGGDGSVLFITTAKQRLSPAQLKAEPLAGIVLALRTGARGIPEPRFAG